MQKPCRLISRQPTGPLLPGACLSQVRRFYQRGFVPLLLLAAMAGLDLALGTSPNTDALSHRPAPASPTLKQLCHAARDCRCRDILCVAPLALQLTSLSCDNLLFGA